MALPTRMLAAAAIVTGVVYNLLLLHHVYENSHFSGDDIITLVLVRSVPFTTYLATPINEHFVPLHRLVAYLVQELAPANFAVALLVLMMCHVVGTVYLHNILRFFERLLRPEEQSAFGAHVLCQTQLSWLLLGLYATQFYLAPLFGWWTAGLHRFPFVMLSHVAIYHYLRYWQSNRRVHLIVCTLAMVAGLGFFIKGIFIPFYLLIIDLTLSCVTRTRPRKPHLVYLTACFLGVAGFLAVWKRTQPPGMTEINTDVMMHLEFIKVTAYLVRDGTIGSIYAADLFHIGRQFAFERWGASALWLGVVAYTIFRNPKNVLVWLALIVVLVPNSLIVSISKFRTQTFGVLAAVLNLRYYFELYSLIAIFLAIIGGEVLSRPRARLARPWLTAILATILMVSVSANAYASAHGMIQHGKARTYIENVKQGAKRLQVDEGHPLRLVDGDVPMSIIGWKASVVLPALGIPVVVVPPHTPGAVQISASGEMAPETLGRFDSRPGRTSLLQ